MLPYFTSMPPYLPALFLTYGHELAYEPVNDRLRLKGPSKYTNLGRALIGLYILCRRQPALQADLAVADCGRSVENVAGEKARASQVKVGCRRNELAHFESWWTSTPTTELVWITIGFIAQFIFSMCVHRAVGRDREGAGEHHSAHGPGVHRRPSGRARDVCLQYLFHLARRARAESGQFRLTQTRRVR